MGSLFSDRSALEMSGVTITSFDVGTKNLGVWVGRFVSSRTTFPFDFQHWEVLSLGTNQLQPACETMVREFERRPFLNDSEWILVENQIDDTVNRRGNSLYRVGRMKAVAQAICTYFFTKRYPAPTCKQIVSVSARNKLHVWDGLQLPPLPVIQRQPKMTQHRHNKLRAIAQTEALLRLGVQAEELDPKWSTFLRGLKKKDDVADAFLQAAYWILKRQRWHGFALRAPGSEDAAESFW